MVRNHRTRRLLMLAALLLALMGSCIYFGDVRSTETAPAGPVPDIDIGPVKLLYPGLAREVPLTIDNPFGFGIDVHTIKVSSGGTSACPAAFLDLGTYDVDGPQIDARSSASAMTTIGLTDNAPETCKGEQFSIRVTVTVGRS